MPKVSVIVPVYNVENYLEICLNSVFSQTLADIEIICVNDGSSDNSLEILNKYKEDKRLIIISQENKGLSAARNTGLQKASGKYIYFLDSDDYIEPTLIEKNIKIMEKYNPDLICFQSEEFGEKNEDIHKYLKNRFKNLQKLDFRKARKTNIYVWNKFYKKNLIDNWNLKFLEGLFFEDIYFNWIYFLRAKKIYYLNENLHHYRLRANSIMAQSEQNKDYKKALHHIYNIEGLVDYFSKDRDLWLQNEKKLIELLDIYHARTFELSPFEANDIIGNEVGAVKEKIFNIKKQMRKKILNYYISKFFKKKGEN